MLSSVEELSKMLSRCFAVCCMSFFGGSKASQINQFPIDSNSGLPDFISRLGTITAQGNSFIAAGIARGKAFISMILGICGFSKIPFPIMETIAVLVVDAAIWKVAYKSVHQHNTFAILFGKMLVGESIRSSTFMSQGIPTKPLYLMDIFGVDKGIYFIAKRNVGYRGSDGNDNLSLEHGFSYLRFAQGLSTRLCCDHASF